MSEPTTDLLARIEPIQRAEDLRPGLAARLLDPLWLLGRQWMLGEFDGEDAGTPVSVDYTLGHYPISRVRAGNVELKVGNLGTPLERTIESLPWGQNAGRCSGASRPARCWRNCCAMRATPMRRDRCSMHLRWARTPIRTIRTTPPPHGWPR